VLLHASHHVSSVSWISDRDRVHGACDRRSESQGGSTTSVVSLEIFEKVTVNSLPWSSATSLVVLAEKLDRTLQHDLGRK
jgi:hypothetical protein